MTASAAVLQTGSVVRLNHDVAVDAGHLVTASRLVRLSPRGVQLLQDRSVEVSTPASAALAGRLLDLDLGSLVLDDRLDPSPDDVTVVVPVKDNAHGLDRLLAQVAGRVRCIVVDDASDDRTSVAAVADRHGVTLLRAETNGGPAAARNLGLRHVATPFVAFVDSDVEVSGDVLLGLVRLFVDPALAAAAPRVLPRGGSGWFQRYEDTNGSLDLGARAAYVRRWSHVAYVPTACLVARVDAVRDGFDVSLRSGEDVDLVWRLQDAGHRVRYAAELTATHDTRRTARAWLGRKAFYGTSAAPLAARHGDRVAPAVMSPVTAVGILGLLSQRRLGMVALAGSVAWGATGWRRTLGLDPHRRRALVRGTVLGTAWQTTGLVLRHWWPVSLVACVVSRRARRAVLSMALVEGLVVHRSSGSQLDPLRFTLARRADDLAYGAGVWWGAARARSVRCLLPRWLPVRLGQGRS